MVDTAGQHVTHEASFFLIFRERQSSERYVVLVFYGLRKASYCFWILTISATAFAICHKVITVLTLLCQFRTKR
jgi:hypothetical protein